MGNRDLVLTGIPRSGTSLMCDLLDRHVNVAVVNESLTQSERAIYELTGSDNFDVGQFHHVFGEFYRNMRDSVWLGEPILAKSGTDTRLRNERTVYRPTNLESEDFLLGTKKTLLYLIMLPYVVSHPDGYRIVAMVRNPRDTISSWIGSFKHLRDASVPEIFRSFSFESEFFSDQEQCSIQQIAAESDVSVRRCRLWRFLHDRIVSFRDQIEIVKYEELILSPSAIIGEAVGVRELRTSTPRITNKSSRSYLSSEDHEHIDEYCGFYDG
ncbi:MAG: sulfotransferase [Pseudomonadales bacterium]|nr:sulfotransferase [Pseudomonadales bacterium]MDP6470807.1 sulfotransferase [Pseudomonadales bacterium]MDP6828241.1 sulfotransferase [Pseudomonadales bacterium]MDP6972320.1 sulfotransferase [Pseudomonadales bacterium]